MKNKIMVRRLFAILLLAWLFTLPAQAQFAGGWTKVDEVRSQYQTITVVDGPKGMRQMIFDGKFDGTDAVQSEMDKARPTDLTLSYAKHMMAALPLAAKQNHIMIIGLGGACLQRYMRELMPGVTVETAELDPAVVDVAKKYFGLVTDDKQKVNVGDGRKFLEGSKDKYDLIILDAFSATSIPYLLATREFLQTCKAHLNEGGAVAANLWVTLPEYQDMLKTYDAVYPEWHRVRCPRSSNEILLAFSVRRELSAEKWMTDCKEFEKGHATGLELESLVEKGMQGVHVFSPGAKVLLDADAARHQEP